MISSRRRILRRAAELAVRERCRHPRFLGDQDLATTLCKTGGVMSSMSWHLGNLASTAFLIAPLPVLLAPRIRAERFDSAIYWLPLRGRCQLAHKVMDELI